jgi:hypothetical protein
MRTWMAMLGMAGCGGGATSAASFPEDYARATCDWLAACDDGFSDSYASESACVDEFVADIGEIDEALCTFDETQAEECLAAIREGDCERDAFEGPVCYRAADCGESST